MTSSSSFFDSIVKIYHISAIRICDIHSGKGCGVVEFLDGLILGRTGTTVEKYPESVPDGDRIANGVVGCGGGGSLHDSK